MKTIFISLFCFTWFTCLAQEDNGMAHLRRYNFSADVCYSTYIPRLLIKPAISLYLLDQGKLYINGHFATEIAKVEKFDIINPSITDALVSNGLYKKFGSREFSVGFNFSNQMDENATITNTWPTGLRGDVRPGSPHSHPTSSFSEPGSMRTIIGGHIGFGSYRTQIFEHPTDVAYLDVNKNLVTADLINLYKIKSNNISQYGFIGLQMFTCGKPERRYDKLYGGGMNTVCLDFIYVTKQYIAPVYNFLNEKYYLSSSEGKHWLGSGIRGSVEGKGSGRGGIHVKFEGGYLPSPIASGPFFFNIDFGIQITPVAKSIIPQKYDY